MNLQNTKQTHRLEKWIYGYGGNRGGLDWEFRMDMYTLLYLK